MRSLMLLFLAACETAPSGPRPAPAPAPAPGLSPPPAQTLRRAPAGVRAKELFDHDDWIGHDVTIELYEPIQDHTMSSLPGPGEYDIAIADVGAKRFGLVPGALTKLPGDLHPPQRVQGRLERAAHGLRIAVASLSPIALPVPAHLASASDLTADPARWAGQYVEVEDDYMAGFEASYFGHPEPGKAVWLSTYPDAITTCAPPEKSDPFGDYQTARIHVIGWAYTARGRYGHMGGAAAELIATRIDYLKPNSCKK